MRECSKAKFLMLMFTLLFSTGCASFGIKMKEWLSGAPVEPNDSAIRFSENPNVEAPARRYERMTSDRLREESQLGPQSGSLWVMEGQGAYLFSQNTSRLVGDILNVQIDGYPEEQIQAKTNVIRDLLKRIEEQDARGLASENSTDSPAAPAAAPPRPEQAAAAKGEGDSPIQLVTTRITEIMKDGNYRVEGEKPFMIGKREYKLLVKGIVRAEDFNERGVSAEKLLDPNFDIVGTRN